jgi:hypothetical protein
LQLLSGGIIKKWESDILFKEKMKSMGNTENGEEDTNRPLRIEDLQGGFFVLFLGYTVGGLAAITEILYFRKCNKSFRKDTKMNNEHAHPGVYKL